MKYSENERDLHKKRIMFAIYKNKIHVVKNIDMGHIDWFRKMGWIDKNNEKQEFNSITRGYIDKTGIYYYRGYNFNANIEDDIVFKENIKELLDITNTKLDIQIYAGVIKGKRGTQFKPKRQIGLAGDLIK